MKIKQIIPRPTEQYPWTYRIEPRQGTVALVHRWTVNEGTPGIWVGSAFYTTEEYATLTFLAWSDA